jgi:hypothetical protein
VISDKHRALAGRKTLLFFHEPVQGIDIRVRRGIVPGHLQVGQLSNNVDAHRQSIRLRRSPGHVRWARMPAAAAGNKKDILLFLFCYPAEDVFADEVVNVHRRLRIGDGSTGLEQRTGSAGRYADILVSDQPFGLDGGDGIVIDLNAVLNAQFYDGHLIILV